MSQVKKAKEEELKASKNEIQLKLEEQAEKLRLVTVLPPAYVVRREGNVLTRVCLSVHGGGGSVCQLSQGGRGGQSSRGRGVSPAGRGGVSQPGGWWSTGGGGGQPGGGSVQLGGEVSPAGGGGGGQQDRTTE